MVAHEGFEPYVSSLKGLRLSLLDQWAIYWTNKRINHLVRERVPIPLILQGLCALTYTVTSVYFALTELGTGLPEGTQTPDLALRRRLLYSAELLEDVSGNLSLFAVSKHYLVVWYRVACYKSNSLKTVSRL